MISIYPTVADTAGGGGRVIIAVDSSAGATSARLGGVALDPVTWKIEDATHVSGVPGAHGLEVVDVEAGRARSVRRKLLQLRGGLGMTLLRQEGVLDRLERSARSDKASATAAATDYGRSTRRV